MMLKQSLRMQCYNTDGIEIIVNERDVTIRPQEGRYAIHCAEGIFMFIHTYRLSAYITAGRNEKLLSIPVIEIW